MLGQTSPMPRVKGLKLWVFFNRMYLHNWRSKNRALAYVEFHLPIGAYTSESEHFQVCNPRKVTIFHGFCEGKCALSGA